MKFSFRQILASAAGAVIAALIASSFGVKGTIIGVAIGSAAATMGTAFVSQSIERGHKAVKQVAVRVPEGPTSTLLRRLGGTGAVGAVGEATSWADGAPREPAPTEVVAAVGDETTEMESAGAPVDADATQRLEISATGDASPTEHLGATTSPLPPSAVVEGAGVTGVAGAAGVARAANIAGTDGSAGGRRFTWKALAGTAAVVFVLALGFVTAIELIADKPLASIYGNTGSGPTLKNIFTPSSPSTTTTTSTSTSTTTTTPSTTTSSTTTPSSTTSTTATKQATTTTTNLGATTTTSPGASTTTTTTAP